MTIDIEKLKARQQELAKESESLALLLRLAEQFSKPDPVSVPAPMAVPTVHLLPQIQLAPQPVQQTLVAEQRRGFTAGLRRAVTMALYTGPAKEADLSRALAWELHRTRVVLSTMLKFKVCFLNEHGCMQLSEEGLKQAQWFIVNPGMLTYRPNPNRPRRGAAA